MLLKPESNEYSVIVQCAVGEDEGGNLLGEVLLFREGCRLDNLDPQPSEELGVEPLRSDDHALPLFFELSPVYQLVRHQYWLHQDDVAELRQAFLHLQDDLLDLLVRQVAEAEHPDYGIIRVALPLELL